MGALEPRLVAITPAMREGSGLVEFEKRFPDRYFDVGIAEQHAVTFAAGLACEGMKPVVAIYSTFLQRAYDQLIHDVALQNLPVVFALDRVGPGGRRRRHACRRLRLRLPALHSEHDRHGAVRRGRMPADAVHRHPVQVARRRALSARHRPGCRGSQGSRRGADRQGRRSSCRASASRCSPSARWWRPPWPPARRSTRRWSTCAS